MRDLQPTAFIEIRDTTERLKTSTSLDFLQSLKGTNPHYFGKNLKIVSKFDCAANLPANLLPIVFRLSGYLLIL